MNKLDSLSLKRIDYSIDIKGWQYLFNIEYENNTTIQVALDDEYVKINNDFYKTNSYNSSDFIMYFE